MSQTPTLMGMLELMEQDVMARPKEHMTGAAFLEKFQVTEEDLMRFQEVNVTATRAMVGITGNPRIAIEGLIQTVLTVGYDLAMAQRDQAALENAGQNKTEAQSGALDE